MDIKSSGKKKGYLQHLKSQFAGESRMFWVHRSQKQNPSLGKVPKNRVFTKLLPCGWLQGLVRQLCGRSSLSSFAVAWEGGLKEWNISLTKLSIGHAQGKKTDSKGHTNQKFLTNSPVSQISNVAASHLHCCSWTGLLHCVFFPGVVGLVRSVLSGNSLGPAFKVLPSYPLSTGIQGEACHVCVCTMCVVMLWSCKSTCSESAQKWHGHWEDAIWKSKLSLPNLPWHSTNINLETVTLGALHRTYPPRAGASWGIYIINPSSRRRLKSIDCETTSWTSSFQTSKKKHHICPYHERERNWTAIIECDQRNVNLSHMSPYGWIPGWVILVDSVGDSQNGEYVGNKNKQ